MQASAEVSECRFWLQLTASILGSRQLDDRKFALSSHLVGTHVRCYCPKCRGVPGNASSFSVCAANLSRLPFLSPSRHVPFENPTSALIKPRSGLCCFSLASLPKQSNARMRRIGIQVFVPVLGLARPLSIPQVLLNIGTMSGFGCGTIALLC